MTPEPLDPLAQLVDEVMERMDDLITLGVGDFDQRTLDLLSRSERIRWAKRAESHGVTLEEVIHDALKAYGERRTDSSWMQEIPQEELGKIWDNGAGVQVRELETMRRRDRRDRESA